MKHLSFLFLATIACIACNDDDKGIIPNPEPLPVQEKTIGLYVCCEGSWKNSNSNLVYYSYENNRWDMDIFLTQNKRGLGDTANDLQLYGGKLYCVLNGSNRIEVIDPYTGKSIHAIPMVNESGVGRQPRNIAFQGNKAYVCSFDGTVARIDTATLAVDGYVTCGRNPDGICVFNDKLYVSNSGGLSFPNYDRTVSVVDISSFEKTGDIEVGMNPGVVLADSEGDVYLISRGDYSLSVFQKIDGLSGTLDRSFSDIPAFNFTICRDTAYIYNYSYSTGQSEFLLFDCIREQIITRQFITDDTSLVTPYGINVNPATGDVYITDALDSSTPGTLYCFGKDGKCKSKTEGIGLGPKITVFINQ